MRLQQRPLTSGLPKFLYHRSFPTRAAAALSVDPEYDRRAIEMTYMPDELTRELTKRMHYAGWRAARATRSDERQRWLDRYYQLRDQVVLGNRKLVYKAVRRRLPVANYADDLVGDCQIVLIGAVAAYNPWLGVRFSTYAYTCLVRALSRKAQRLASDWLSRTLSLDGLSDEPPQPSVESRFGALRIDEYLRDDHPLLSPREKAIVIRRFNMAEKPGGHTLENVGRALGLSKERVRQVQATALDKLRGALSIT